MSFTSENTLSAEEAVNAAGALFCFIWPSRKQTTDHEETQRIPVTLGLPSSEMAFYFRATALLKYTHAFRFLFFFYRQGPFSLILWAWPTPRTALPRYAVSATQWMAAEQKVICS